MMRVIHLSAAQLAHRHTWIHNERHTALARLTSASAEYATALLVLLLAVASLLSPSSHSTRRTAAALAAMNVAPVAGMCMVVCTLSQSQQSAHGKLCVEWTLLRVYSCLYYRALVRVLANKQVGYSTCAVRCTLWGFLMEVHVTHIYMRRRMLMRTKLLVLMCSRVQNSPMPARPAPRHPWNMVSHHAK